MPVRVEVTTNKRSKIYHAGAAAQRIERALAETLGAPISAEAALYFNRLIVEDEAQSVALAEANGATFLEPEEMVAWRAGARGVWSDFAPVVGGMEMIEAVAQG